MFMNTDDSELTLMQLSDSFFPSGMYTMSNGLETVFDQKRVRSESDVHDFLENILEQQPVSYTHLTLPTKRIV